MSSLANRPMEGTPVGPLDSAKDAFMSLLMGIQSEDNRKNFLGWLKDHVIPFEVRMLRGLRNCVQKQGLNAYVGVGSAASGG